MHTRTAWLTVTLLMATATARGDEPAADAVHLAWNAPPGCPSRDAVMGEVQRMLGGTTSHHATVQADVTEVGAAHWSVHLATNVDGAAGERSLEADSCASLASATALIVAWTVDPAKARAQRPPDPPPPLPPPTPPPAETPAVMRPPEPPRVLVAAEGLGDLGTLPSPGFGVGVTLGAMIDRARLELAGADWLTQDANATAPAGQGTHIHLLEGVLRGCFRGHVGDRFEVDPCVGGGFVHATSEGFGGSPTFQTNQNSANWGALHGALLLGFRLVGLLAFRGSLGASIPLERPPFVLSPQRDVQLHKAALGAGRATLGVEVRFP